MSDRHPIAFLLWAHLATASALAPRSTRLRPHFSPYCFPGYQSSSLSILASSSFTAALVGRPPPIFVSLSAIHIFIPNVPVLPSIQASRKAHALSCSRAARPPALPCSHNFCIASWAAIRVAASGAMLTRPTEGSSHQVLRAHMSIALAAGGVSYDHPGGSGQVFRGVPGGSGGFRGVPASCCHMSGPKTANLGATWRGFLRMC